MFKTVLTPLLFAVALFSTPAAASEPESPAPRARNVIHAELATMVMMNAVSLNYERLLSDHLALRVGYGASHVLAATQTKRAHGPLAMVAVFFGKRSRFELAAGASIVSATLDAPFDNHLGGSWYAVPNFELGYRYQHRAGGVVWRAGFALSSAFGAPFALGVGYAF
jgi:hypothetical protein